MLALAGILIFPPLQTKTQDIKIIKENKKDLIENIDTIVNLDTMRMNVLLEWFEYNTFIKIKVISRSEYDELQENFVKEDDEDILYLPEDL